MKSIFPSTLCAVCCALLAAGCAAQPARRSKAQDDALLARMSGPCAFWINGVYRDAGERSAGSWWICHYRAFPDGNIYFEGPPDLSLVRGETPKDREALGISYRDLCLACHDFHQWIGRQPPLPWYEHLYKKGVDKRVEYAFTLDGTRVSGGAFLHDAEKWPPGMRRVLAQCTRLMDAKTLSWEKP